MTNSTLIFAPGLSLRKDFLLAFWLSLLFFSTLNAACQQQADTTRLREVVVVGNIKKHESNISNSLEDYLEREAGVGLIKRGAYGWEPILGNMLSERSVVTIDGMRIFGACTDKMDPVTSYVETNNISQIEVYTGQEGALHGSTVAGGIDLKRKRGNFSSVSKFYGNLHTSYGSNDWGRFHMFQGGLNSKKFWVATSLGYRFCDNYKSGGGTRVKYSGFQKYNTSIDLGFKVGNGGVLMGDFIFDKAIDVGYPALPMDVSLAQTSIFSLSYRHNFSSDFFRDLEAKIYFNDVTHIMDDTTREEGDKLPVHMDMPGWSTTYGTYGILRAKSERWQGQLKLSGYSSLRTAQMTMYYRDGGDMFMYTWPQVRTNQGSLYSHHSFDLALNQSLNLWVGASFETAVVESDVGLNSNRTFFPHMPRSKTRFLPNSGLSYSYFFEDITLSGGLGYGHRAPSVSEGYGFYLFNSFDGFDYIGNPDLKNEISHQANISAVFARDGFSIEGKTTGFYIKNYIMGERMGQSSWQMTPLQHKNGVKVYRSLPYAYHLNSSLSLSYNFADFALWKNSLGYAFGKDNKGNNLPFIRPLYYQSTIKAKKGNFWGDLSVEGDFEQTSFSSIYGEDATPAYTVVNLLFGWNYNLPHHKLSLQLGVENIFDRFYSTYADWNNFPRKGRNISLGVKYAF